MKKGIKIILIVLISLAILLLTLTLVLDRYVYWKQKQEISKLPDYYKELAEKCPRGAISNYNRIDNFDCCMLSIRNAAEGEWELVPATGCPEGYHINFLKCIPSLRWCESDIVNWETYRNEEYGFEVKYPGDWKLSERRDLDPYEFSFSISEPSERYNVYISVSREDTTRDPEENFVSYIYFGDKQTINLSGEDVIAYLFPRGWECYGDDPDLGREGGPCSGFDIPIKYGNYYYLIGGSNNVITIEGIYSQILSTFKFLEPIGSSGWKTYKDEEHGIEFDYPSELRLEKTSADYTGSDEYKKQLYDNIILLESEDFQGVKGGWRISINGPVTLIENEKKSWPEIVKQNLYPNHSFIKKDIGIRNVLITADNQSAQEYANSSFSELLYFTNGWNYKVIQFSLETLLSEKSIHEQTLYQIISGFKFIYPLDMAKWETYTSEEDGAEFKYPPNTRFYGFKPHYTDYPEKGKWDVAQIFLDKSNINISIFSLEEFVELYGDIYSQLVKLNEDFEGFQEDRSEENRSPESYGGPTYYYSLKMKINGTPALDQPHSSVGGAGRAIYVLRDNKVFEIYHNKAYFFVPEGDKEKDQEYKIFNQILSTFKFLE